MRTKKNHSNGSAEKEVARVKADPVDRLAGRNGGAAERERALRRQCDDVDGRERVVGVRVGEIEVGGVEGVGRVLVRRERLGKVVFKVLRPANSNCLAQVCSPTHPTSAPAPAGRTPWPPV